jgi:hypothetical protein
MMNYDLETHADPCVRPASFATVCRPGDGANGRLGWPKQQLNTQVGERQGYPACQGFAALE